MGLINKPWIFLEEKNYFVTGITGTPSFWFDRIDVAVR